MPVFVADLQDCLLLRVVSDAGDMRQRATSIPTAFHGAKAAGKVELSAFADYARSYADYDNSPDLDEEQVWFALQRYQI